MNYGISADVAIRSSKVIGYVGSGGGKRGGACALGGTAGAAFGGSNACSKCATGSRHQRLRCSESPVHRRLPQSVDLVLGRYRSSSSSTHKTSRTVLRWKLYIANFAPWHPLHDRHVWSWCVPLSGSGWNHAVGLQHCSEVPAVASRRHWVRYGRATSKLMSKFLVTPDAATQ